MEDMSERPDLIFSYPDRILWMSGRSKTNYSKIRSFGILLTKIRKMAKKPIVKTKFYSGV